MGLVGDRPGSGWVSRVGVYRVPLPEYRSSHRGFRGRVAGTGGGRPGPGATATLRAALRSGGTAIAAGILGLQGGDLEPLPAQEPIGEDLSRLHPGLVQGVHAVQGPGEDGGHLE
jgi:hypothetical protein